MLSVAEWTISTEECQVLAQHSLGLEVSSNRDEPHTDCYFSSQCQRLEAKEGP